jgi:hypothetical protein
MSWRAALLYAVVAVLAGSFFTATAYYAEAAASWALEDRRVNGFVYVYALTVAGATPTLLVFAAMVRAVTRLLRWNGFAPWTLAGGILGVAVPWMFSALGYALDRLYFPNDLQGLKRGLMFPLIGPMMYAVQPFGVRVTIGLATSIALWMIVRTETRAASGRGV